MFLPMYRIPTMVVALATLVLALAVIGLRPGDRVHRTFSAFLLFRGGAYLFVALDPEVGSLMERYSGYFFLAIPFAAMVFARAFHLRFSRRKMRGAPRVDWPTVLLIVAGVAVEAWYALDHDLFLPGTGVSLVTSFQTLSYLSYGLVAWLLARDHVNAPDGQHRRSLWLLSLGMGVDAVFRPALILPQVVYVLLGGDGSISPGDWIAIALLAFALAFSALAILTLRQGRTGPGRYGWTMIIAAATGPLVTALYFVAPPSVARLTQFMVEGFWIFLLVLLTAYALLRCRLFGIELGAKRFISAGTIAAPFAVVFFLAGETLEGFAQARFGISGYWLSLAAAGLITLALAPLQRLAHALANRLLPDVEDSAAYRAHRAQEMYQAAIEEAVDDQAITPRERVLLESVRKHLELDAHQAKRMEKAVLMSVLAAAPS